MATAGDDVLAGEIVDLQPRLYRFARSLTSDPEEASDLAQEATARALRARLSFAPGTNLRAWLFRILRNTYLNQRRIERRHAAPNPVVLSVPDLEWTGSGLRSVEHDVLVRAELRAVLEAFRRLPERYATRRISADSREASSQPKQCGVTTICSTITGQATLGPASCLWRQSQSAHHGPSLASTEVNAYRMVVAAASRRQSRYPRQPVSCGLSIGWGSPV